MGPVAVGNSRCRVLFIHTTVKFAVILYRIWLIAVFMIAHGTPCNLSPHYRLDTTGCRRTFWCLFTRFVQFRGKYPFAVVDLLLPLTAFSV